MVQSAGYVQFHKTSSPVVAMAFPFLNAINQLLTYSWYRSKYLPPSRTRSGKVKARIPYCF